MATITGTSGNDVLAGTIDADVISGGAGNDRINGNAGDDEIRGGLGSDILTGDAGNDSIFGEDDNDGIYGGGGDDLIDGGAGDDILIGDGGNDVILGGAGNDKLYGSSGHDRLDGGAGDDVLYGEAGDDVFVVAAGMGSDTVVGGAGMDRLELDLRAADVTQAFRSELAAFVSWSAEQAAAAGSMASLAGQTSGPTFHFASVGLTLSAIETLAVRVDGTPVPLQSFLNQAPQAAPSVAFEVLEDSLLEGRIVATDSDGDALTFAVAEGPATGDLQIDAETGAFAYKPAANASGMVSFSVRISDPSGASVVQDVHVNVAGVADQPVLSVSNVVAPMGQSYEGTSGTDVMAASTVPGMAEIALDIGAALTDTDGSETLFVSVSGVPEGAMLSAGVRQADGTWRLGADELSGLKLTTRQGVDLQLGVTAVASESNGSQAVAHGALSVTFDRANTGDVMVGAAGNDVIRAGSGHDLLSGGSGDDKVYGNAGNDVFLADAGNDFYDAGAGFDTLDFSAATAAVVVDLSRSKAEGAETGTDVVRNFEAVIGTSAGDTLIGSKFDNTLEGGAGDDDLRGGAGNDTLHGGAGNDRLDGGSGNDILSDGDGNDTVMGGSGNDLIMAGAGDDRYVGGSGFDTLDYSLATGPVNVDVSKKSITGWGSDTIDGIEKVIGTAFADTFKGSSKVDVLDGGAGNDTLRGMEGADILTGGEGADTFVWFMKDVVSGSRHLGVDRITDFGPGDQLNVRDFTKSFKGAAIEDLVRLTEGADGTMLSVKSGSKFVDVVFLEKVSGLSVSSLYDDGMLVA